jgi:hypothetical protein
MSGHDVGPVTRWQERQTWFFRGAPAAIVPALLFLPGLAYLCLTPAFGHARLVAGVSFVPLAASEVWGLARLVRCCAQRELDLVSVLAFGALLVVLVIAVYSAFFLAVLAGHLF